jgi:prepilin-type N-terminal cleavage/methylation domain-containing protein
MRPSRTPRPRRGLSLVEVMVALGILGGVMLGLGMFAAAQLASERLEKVKGAPRYSAVESLFVATESSIPFNAGFFRQTWVTRVGGLATDTIDYKIVTVQVTNSQMPGSVRKTTVLAPF